MNESDFDKNFNFMFRLGKLAVFAAFLIMVVSSIVSVGFIGTAIYLLLKNFG
jgi:hypothetical protein